MRIGETIKKLRKQKDMTQEQLAEYLNISPQAVSRWEINTSLPDITLIPMLANIFDVTSDILLGIDIDSKEKRIDKIISDAWHHDTTGHRGEALQMVRDALKEYPNSHKLKSALTSFIHWNTNPELIKTEEEKAKYAAAQNEIITIGEIILAECTDDEIRHKVITNMCMAYVNKKENEKAQALAEKLPTSGDSREHLLSFILKGTKLHQHLQREIMSGLDKMAQSFHNLHKPLDDGSNPYTPDEQIVMLKKFLEIYQIVFEDGDYGFSHMRLGNFHNSLTKLYLTKGDTESALKHLELAAKHTIEFDVHRNSFKFYKEFTSLLFRGNSTAQTINLPHSSSYIMIERINNKDEFNFIRNHEKVIEIIAELEKYAK